MVNKRNKTLLIIYTVSLFVFAICKFCIGGLSGSTLIWNDGLRSFLCATVFIFFIIFYCKFNKKSYANPYGVANFLPLTMLVLGIVVFTSGCSFIFVSIDKYHYNFAIYRNLTMDILIILQCVLGILINIIVNVFFVQDIKIKKYIVIYGIMDMIINFYNLIVYFSDNLTFVALDGLFAIIHFCTLLIFGLLLIIISSQSLIGKNINLENLQKLYDKIFELDIIGINNIMLHTMGNIQVLQCSIIINDVKLYQEIENQLANLNSSLENFDIKFNIKVEVKLPIGYKNYFREILKICPFINLQNLNIDNNIIYMEIYENNFKDKVPKEIEINNKLYNIKVN